MATSIRVEQMWEEPMKYGHPNSGSVNFLIFRIQSFCPFQTMDRVSGIPAFGRFQTFGDQLFQFEIQNSVKFQIG